MCSLVKPTFILQRRDNGTRHITAGHCRSRAGDPAVRFLGSGKTTLANRILTEHHDQRIAVIVNEFGDVGIDGQLIVGVEDNVVELSNGCLCCTVQGDLADTLRQLLGRRRQTLDAQAVRAHCD